LGLFFLSNYYFELSWDWVIMDSPLGGGGLRGIDFRMKLEYCLIE
jgi:hypothetical protein